MQRDWASGPSGLLLRDSVVPVTLSKTFPSASLSTRLPVAYLQTDHASDATIRKQHTLLDLLGPGVCGADTDGDANGR